MQFGLYGENGPHDMQTLKHSLTVSSLLLLVALPCKAQVYSVGAYSFGHTYSGLCSIAVPFPPQNFHLTEIAWREDGRGFTITDSYHKAVLGDVSRRDLRVECGSEKFTFPLDPAMKTSGDLAGLLTQCVTNHGGQLPVNVLPVVQATWIRHSRALEDIIVIDGDRFTEIQRLLEHVWGMPDPDIKATELSVNGHSVTYTPNQIGVILNLTGSRTQTIISILAKRTAIKDE